MAITRWEPKAHTVKQLDLIAVAGVWGQNDTITFTINKKVMVITVGSSTSTSDVADAIKEAWNGEAFTGTAHAVVPTGGGSDIVEFTEFTATVSATVVSLTANTGGVPITLVVTEVTSSTGTAPESTSRAATGPNFVDNSDNWSETGDVTPSTGDDVYIDNTDVSILYGLANLSGTLASCTIGKNFTGDIGLPEKNAAGYDEYRQTFLDLVCTILNIGTGDQDATGSGRIIINSGSVLTTVNVLGTGSPAEDGLPAFIWRGTDSNNAMVVNDGSVGIASFGGEVATLSTLDIAGGEVQGSAGLSLTTLVLENGSLDIDLVAATLTTFTQKSGESRITGTAIITTLNADGGTVDHTSAGTITTLNIGGTLNPATVDLSGTTAAVTIDNINLKSNSTLIVGKRAITYTNDVVVDGSVDTITGT